MSDNSLLTPAGQRFDRALLNRDLYPQSEAVRPRFQDLDPLNHINNTAMAAMFEAARVRFNQPLVDYFREDNARVLIGGVVSNYVAEAHLNPEIIFHLGVGRIGTSSWTLQSAAYQGETAVYAGQATMVLTRSGGPAPLSPDFRAALISRRLNLPD